MQINLKQFTFTSYVVPIRFSNKTHCCARSGFKNLSASECGEYDTVRFLLEQGASVEAKDDEQWNVVMWAAVAGQYEICELLV